MDVSNYCGNCETLQRDLDRAIGLLCMVAAGHVQMDHVLGSMITEFISDVVVKRIQ